MRMSGIDFHYIQYDLRHIFSPELLFSLRLQITGWKILHRLFFYWEQDHDDSFRKIGIDGPGGQF